MKKKVLIVQPLLAHYRDSLFKHLINSSEFEIEIIGGTQIDNVKEIQSNSENIIDNLINKKIRVAGHTFIWQVGAVRHALKKKPGIIVLTGVDPHLVSNLWLCIFCKLFFGAKIIWWGHGDIEKKGIFGKFFRRFFFNQAKGIFTYSDAGKKKLESFVHKKVRIISIKNCINDDEYGFNHKQGSSMQIKRTSTLMILFSGRITKEKRLDILIAALEILQQQGFDFKCNIIGVGINKENIERQVAEKKLYGKVEFLGERYLEECYSYFDQSDLFILPGKVGLSIIHGLSYGLPVITSDKMEIHSPEFEIIKPGYNGDFFAQMDPLNLATKIILWNGIITANRKKIKEQCISSIINDGYTPQSMSYKMIELFRTLSN